MARWGVLTGKELAFLCGEDARPPAWTPWFHDFQGDGVVLFLGRGSQGARIEPPPRKVSASAAF